MVRVAAILLIAAGLVGAMGHIGIVRASDRHAALVDVDDALAPVTADFLRRAVDKAAGDGAQLLIIRLDTPGGLLDATRDMLDTVQSAPIPIVVYVAPDGAHAASAGTFLTAWAHVAAMAPVTNIGAAAPVGPGGKELDDTIKAKATEDALALFRGIAEQRGRNSDALEQTVLEAKSFSATEALDLGIIDLIAEDVDGLLDDLDGRSVALKDRTVVLDTDGVEILTIRRTLLERFLSFLADPNVFFLLFIIGGIGVLIEFVAPGLIVPGVGGGILLALAFVAAGYLPVSFVGIVLLVLAIALLYVELQAPGIGVAGAGGVICFVLGALLLFGGFTPPGLPQGPPDLPSPSVRVDIWLLAVVGASVFGLLWFVVRDMAAARRAGESAGAAAPSLVGQTALATTALTPNGTIQLAGESWSAVNDSREIIPEGTEVTVVRADGLVLHVQHVLEAGEFRDSRYDDDTGHASLSVTEE